MDTTRSRQMQSPAALAAFPSAETESETEQLGDHLNQQKRQLLQKQDRQPQQQQQQPGPNLLNPSANSASRSSLSSVDSFEFVRMNASPTKQKRWSTLDAAGKFLLIFSVIFLISGVIVTVFGFTNLNLTPGQQLPMQIIGPACLVATAMMWLVGGVFCRLWIVEIRHHKQAMELRTRVQLHALAMDMLKKPNVFSPTALQDPRVRRQLLLKLRQQNALDASSIDTSCSRRSSRAVSIDARRRQSAGIVNAILRNAATSEHRKSTDASIGGSSSIVLPAQFDLPGIHISRIETLDFDDASVFSGYCRSGTKRYIIIESDGSSDFSRLSFPNSECSFSAGSRSSRSRSSRDSSNFSSRLWDFSPRESDWEVNVPLNSRDLAGGSRDYSLLSPSMPRKGSVVTFDICESSMRRHSSPASSIRRKDNSGAASGGAASTGAGGDYSAAGGGKQRDSNGKSEGTFSNMTVLNVGSFRKRSAGDQSLMSIAIDENDGDEDDDDDDDHDDDEDDEEDDVETTPLSVSNGGGNGGGAVAESAREGDRKMSVNGGAEKLSALTARRRSSLLRNNTDDSEVERRVAKIFREIDCSLTDCSVDDPRCREKSSLARKSEASEAETQTFSEQEVESVGRRQEVGDSNATAGSSSCSKRTAGSENDGPETDDSLRIKGGACSTSRKLSGAKKMSRLSSLTSSLFARRGFNKSLSVSSSSSSASNHVSNDDKLDKQKQNKSRNNVLIV